MPSLASIINDIMNHRILTSTFFAIFALATAATASAKTKAAKNLQSRKSSAFRFRSLRRKNTPRTPHRWHRRFRYALHRLRDCLCQREQSWACSNYAECSQTWCTCAQIFHIATLSLSTFQGLFDIYLLGIPAPPSGYRFSALFCVTITMFWRLNEK